MNDVIACEHLIKRLGQREVLKDVTFAVKEGDIFGYLGPNGAGKTTSIRVMLGLFAPDSGTVAVLGENPAADGVRKKIGFVLETDGLYENMTAQDNLRYYAQIYDVPAARDRIDTVVRLVSLSDRLRDKVGTYSKGMRQRLALARAMLHNPQVLILDEPSAGVDPTGQIEIRQVMLDLARKEHKTILLSSHNLDEVQRICNRVALIHKGQIRLYGELSKLQHEMSHGEVVVETAAPVAAELIAELRGLPGVSLESQEGNLLTVALGKDVEASSIVSFLASRGVKIEQFKKQEATLEQMYTTILKEAGER